MITSPIRHAVADASSALMSIGPVKWSSGIRPLLPVADDAAAPPTVTLPMSQAAAEPPDDRIRTRLSGPASELCCLRANHNEERNVSTVNAMVAAHAHRLVFSSVALLTIALVPVATMAAKSVGAQIRRVVEVLRGPCRLWRTVGENRVCWRTWRRAPCWVAVRST